MLLPLEVLISNAMLVSKQTAVLIENCIKQTHIDVTCSYPVQSVLNISGGAACFSGTDSFLTQVIGWGFDTERDRFGEDIADIEQFYRQQGHPQVDIELCPLVPHWLPLQLGKRGYQLTEMNTISILDLRQQGVQRHSNNTSCLIRPMEKSELSAWARVVAHGFNCLEAEEHFYRYASARNVTAFAALVDNNLVAGGTIAIHDGIGDLGVTSTLPLYRGKGLQKALLFSRLQFAKEQGAQLAVVTTAPGSVSELNCQKAGFHCAYTRVKLTLGLE